MPLDSGELIDEIQVALKPFGYAPEFQNSIPNALFITYIKNKHPFKVRNLCALVRVSDKVSDDPSAKSEFKYIRSCLLHKYGDAFLWKELEIVFVVVCDNSKFALLKESNGAAVDQAGFTLNAMLGSIFINEETFEYFWHSAFGIYFSGDHFKALNSALSAWCDRQKKSMAA
jgi:hypothetical protein